MSPAEAMAMARAQTKASGGSIETLQTPTAAFDEVATEAPAPLPLLGAGVAFAYSRKVRRRVSQGASGKFVPAQA